MLYFIITEIGHPGPREGASRAKQEDGGTSISPVCHLHPLRPTLSVRDSAEGGDVQEQT